MRARLMILASLGAAPAHAQDVVVNGRELPVSTIAMLEHTYTMIVEGAY